MKPNNYYYREIAKKLGYTWDEKFHSSYYFMRKIAEQCKYSYDTRKPSNKYLRDFHTYITGNTPSGFEYNVYYLYNIAKELYAQTESAKTENYYLKIIYENIDVPTPVATDITWTLNGAEEGESAILSHADGDDAVFVFTVTGESSTPIPNYQIPIEVDGVAVSPTPVTDANGEATYTYESSGAGDVAIDVDCTLLTKRYSILDTKAYFDNSKISAWSTSSVGGGTDYKSNYNLSDGETAYFKLATMPNWFVIGLYDGSSYFQLQRVENTNTARIYTNGVSSTDYSHTFSANDVIKFERVSSTEQKVYINDTLLHTASNHSFSNPKLMIRKYNTSPYTMDYIYIL